MATRTQKAAMKKKADEAKAAKADETAVKAAKPADAKAPKAAKAKVPKAKPAKGKGKGAPKLQFEEIKDPKADKPSWAERFWHALSGKAEKAEKTAHVHAVQREKEHAKQLAAEKKAQEAAAEAERKAKQEAEAAARRKEEQSKRDLLRIAKEEEARMKEEAHQAKLDAARAKREEAKRAKEAAQEQARQAAQRAKDEAEAAERAKEEAHQAKLAAAREKRAEEKRLKDEEEARKEAEHQAKLAAAREKRAEEKRLQQEAERVAEEEKARKAAEKAAAKKADDARRKAEAEAQAELAAKKAKRSAPASESEAQADRLADELAARRSKPVVIVADDEVDTVPALPGLGRHRAPKEEGEVRAAVAVEAAPPARIEGHEAAPRGLGLPESFILLALENEWDERREKAASGGLGGALAGAIVLELALRGRILVQRDRLTITGGPLDNPGLEAAAQKLSLWQDLPSLQAMGKLAKENPELLPPFKDHLKERGYIDHAAWRHLGMMRRTQVVLTDPDAQERLRGKLRRAIAGGGTPDAPTILALGLLDAAGLFETVVPPGAVDYNRKRLNGLLAGRDVMGYAVDKELKGMQEVAVRTVLGNVRLMTRA